VISTIRFGYIKSFAAPQTIRLGKPDDVLGSGYNVIVGANNSGKTTIINTIRDLLSRGGNLTIGQEARHHSDKPVVEVVWEDVDGVERVTIDPNIDGAIFPKVGNRERAFAKLRFVPSRRPFASEYGTHILSVQDYEHGEFDNRRGNPSYFDSQLATTVASYFTNPLNKSQFLEVLKKVDPHSTKFSTDNVGNKNVLLYEGPSKRLHIISDTGDGITNLIRIIFALVTSEAGDSLVIDEPELSLHPQLQRNLYKLLLTYSRDRQIIVVTHSPHFVGWPEISEKSRLFRVFINRDGNSTIKSPTSDSFNAVKAYSNVMSRKYYDSVCKELFFSDRAVLLEGSEDVHYIENFLEATGQAALPIMGYGCGGASVIRPWMRLCVDLGIKCAAVFDGDMKAEFEAAVNEFDGSADVASFLLPRDDIRDKHRRTESGAETAIILKPGIFRRDGVIHHDARESFQKTIDEVRAFIG
jgi:predicted ATP-dependent endonuclease of OLD family